MSTRSIQKSLDKHFDSNGWFRSDQWVCDPRPTVLTEYWEIRSRWSPADATLYIGFENYDIYESVGVSLSRPVPYEKNEWLTSFCLLGDWQNEFSSFVKEVERIRKTWNLDSND